MKEIIRVVALGTGLACGSRHAPPIPVPTPEIEIGVEQALVADGELLLVGISIGTSAPDGVVVDSVDAAANLGGIDLGELELVPMMEARMPPWTLMLMWQIPTDIELHFDMESSITGTVSWRANSPEVRYSSFTLPLMLEAPLDSEEHGESGESDAMEESEAVEGVPEEVP